jgi:putative ABC transport system permease protein
MFFTYLSRELRRRSRQALVIALGLALGIGLTVAVNAASAGVRSAQSKVLASLYGVGTDITVTTNPGAGTGDAPTFNIKGQGQTTGGTKVTHTDQDIVQVAPGAGTIGAATLAKIRHAAGVAGAVGALDLIDVHFSGSLSQTVTLPPGSGSGGTGSALPAAPAQAPVQVSGPSGSFNFAPTTVEGVDVSNPSLGPMSALTVTSGRDLAAADKNSKVALVNAGFAKQKKIKLGSKITLGGTSFTVVGVVSTSSAEDYFIPLAVAQSISSEPNAVSTVYVKASDGGRVNAVAAAIKSAAPGSTVSTSADLAASVTGSISSTASLADNLGKWLSIAVLLAAFLVAALFTVAAVGRRTREFGTLKAIGWSSPRVVRQVLGESVAIGLIGGALGIGLGYAAAFTIDKIAPALTAQTAVDGASNPVGGAAGSTVSAAPAGGLGASPSVTVHLNAPVDVGLLLAAVGLALLGGLIAGGLGGWRASSLRPADALAKVA